MSERADFGPPRWQWRAAMERLEVDGRHTDRTGAVESLLVILSGTFDLVAGGGSWPARGVRQSPLLGKPVALFLPPNTGFELTGNGTLLLTSGVQPEQKEEKGEAATKKPLLALAGSGKAFDPASGDWKLSESFPSSPQALLPRHIDELNHQGVIQRRVFPYDFKALCLSLDELVIPAGAAIDVPPACEFPDYPSEVAAYFDAPGGIEIDGAAHTGRGFVPSLQVGSRIVAGAGDAYVAVAFAGAKLT